MEEDVGPASHIIRCQPLGTDHTPVLMISSAADLPPTVAGVDQLLGLAAQEAEYPDTHPAPEEDEEHEDAEDIRAAPALGDVVLWVVLAHSFETLECYWIITSVTESMQTKRMTPKLRFRCFYLCSFVIHRIAYSPE